jgi:hypothetical protein
VRANVAIFWLLSLFFGILSIVYALWTMAESAGPNVSGDLMRQAGEPEWVGTVGLALSSVLSTFLAFYLQITHRAQGGELPEDVLTADIDDGDPELGHFSPWSWWPLVLAFGLGLMFLGFAVGIWVTFIGAPITLIAVIGWNFEYYRSNFAR